jgi:hypothetical protein
LNWEKRLAADGDHVWVFLALPVLFSALPLLASGWRHQATVTAAWLLLAFCLLTGFTIGLFYWPSFVLMVIAAYAGARARRTRIGREAGSSK